MIRFICRILGSYFMLVGIAAALGWLVLGKFDDPTHQANIFIGCLAMFFQFFLARGYLARHSAPHAPARKRKTKRSRWITKPSPTPIVTHATHKMTRSTGEHWVHAVHHLPPELRDAIIDGLNAADTASRRQSG